MSLAAHAAASATGRCDCCARSAASTWWNCPAPRSAAGSAAPSPSRTPTRRWRWAPTRPGTSATPAPRCCRQRQLLPGAHRRHAVPAAQRHAGPAPGRDPGVRPRRIRHDRGPSARRRHARPSSGCRSSRWRPRRRWADSVQRKQPAHATGIIRTKRAGVVDELDNWEQLRLAAEAIKDGPCSRLDEHLEAFEATPPRQAPPCTGPRDAEEANRIVVDLVRAKGADRSRQGQVDGHPGDRAQRGPGRRRDRRLGDRPGRAHRAARRRLAQPHPGAGHPPQPRRDARHLPAGDGQGGRRRPPISPTNRAAWPRRPACTCARSSCAPRSPSPAPTSRSPTPAPWSSSNPKATAGCA